MRTLPTGKARCGFTLFELILVIVIFAVLAGAIAPRFTGGIERARLKGTAFAAAYLAASAARIAAANGRVVKLLFDSGGRVIKLETDVETEMGEVGAPIELSEGIKIESVEVIGRPGYEEDVEEEAVRFFPDGRADEAYIVLVGEAGGKYTVIVNPVTGYAQVAVGEKEQDDWSELESVRESQSMLEQ